MFAKAAAVVRVQNIKQFPKLLSMACHGLSWLQDLWEGEWAFRPYKALSSIDGHHIFEAPMENCIFCFDTLMHSVPLQSALK